MSAPEGGFLGIFMLLESRGSSEVASHSSIR